MDCLKIRHPYRRLKEERIRCVSASIPNQFDSLIRTILPGQTRQADKVTWQWQTSV